MSTFRLTPDAKRSLIQIASYTKDNWGKKQRNTYLKRLDDCLHTLANDPKLGTQRLEIHPTLRSYTVAKHVVFYIVKPTMIVIVNILHERMDFEQHF